jgi:hypothetical protein
MKDYPVVGSINVKEILIFFCILSACFESQRRTEVCPSVETLLYNSVERKVTLEVMDQKRNVRREDVAIKFHCRLQSTSSYDVIASKANWYNNCSDYDRTNFEICNVILHIFLQVHKIFYTKRSFIRRDLICACFAGFKALYPGVL